MTWKPASLILATFAFTVPAHTQGNAPEPEGYRTDDYRAPVPTTLAGAQVLATEEAEAIQRSGAGAFIDVLPKPQLPAGTIWREKPRFKIFLVALGCRTPGLESSLRRRKIICGRGLAVPPVATTQSCW